MSNELKGAPSIEERIKEIHGINTDLHLNNPNLKDKENKAKTDQALREAVGKAVQESQKKTEEALRQSGGNTAGSQQHNKH